MRSPIFFTSLLLTAILAACGGSDDTLQPPPPPPPPPIPPIEKCNVHHPVVPAGQTHAVSQTLDRLNASATGRFSEFFASGVGIPTDKGYGQLHLTPLDASSPVTRIDARLTELDGCSEISIYTLEHSLRSNETLRSFDGRPFSPATPVVEHYILDGFEYRTSAPAQVAFHIDPAKYPHVDALNTDSLHICSFYYTVDTNLLSCFDTQVRRDGPAVVVEATLPRSSLYPYAVLTFTKPRGVDTMVPSDPPPLFGSVINNPPVTAPAGHPEVCGPSYPAITHGDYAVSEKYAFNDKGIGRAYELALAGKNIPVDRNYDSMFLDFWDEPASGQSMSLSLAALTDCTHGRITNLQRNIHANETITSFARNKNFGGEMQYQNLHVLEGFAYSGFDPHIGKRVQFTIDSLRYPEAIQQAPKDVFRICKLSYQTTGTNLTCAKTQVRALSDYWTVYAEFDDPHIGQWIEHDEEYLLTATTPRGRDTLVTP
ncbi:hypothetical protein EII18_12900 [Comamonadaceae bacterium OH3737_COT-264]|nr:hypothetical protein EII18_12900 [Comamonadaceae bacterium OH3737_COT-264]